MFADLFNEAESALSMVRCGSKTFSKSSIWFACKVFNVVFRLIKKFWSKPSRDCCVLS